ncbi:hypothetical protein [Streptomyces sp. SID10815]|uniref:hypothetical protein n=1 Tax=Streptomyces sp. SID10815 TaxID=2706027 RepID=UPI0013C68FF5|nr:hypothetical protein [Streptomyces sp. SID10815]NEA51759.1 hypothetical protein [Streptomyces sp. SID10815]
MTDSLSSFIGEAHGSVHSGDGPQFNFYVQAAQRLLGARERRRPHSIAAEDRRRLLERFVPPPGLQQARDRLRTERAVLVDGLPGSGRRTAALMLLHELPDDRGSLHELPDTSDDDTALPLDPADINPGDRLLLDLSEAEEARFLGVQGTLSDFRSRVIDRGAHLAVVLPHHLGYLLRSDVRHLMAEIRRPDARRVLAVHLRADGILPTEEEVAGPELAAFLNRVPIADVAALGDRIRRYRNASTADHGFPHWLAQALSEQHDQTSRVAADLKATTSGRHRALLLSLAMFHGATPDVVLAGANNLLRMLSHPPDPTPRLERADLHAELDAIHALSTSEVRFRTVGYDRAVRSHFWTYLPDIRRQLRDWLGGRVADPAMSPAVRERAIDRFADQALRVDRPEDLAWLADRWMSSRSSAHLVPQAAQALALGLHDDRHGRFFRQRIYDWSLSRDTSDQLRRVLIVVCSQTMARSHPDQALVRLHHVARRSRGSTGEEAERAVIDLSRSDDRMYRKMLARLSDGIALGLWPADLTLFRELADPVRLGGDATVRKSLATGWGGLLRRPAPEWTGVVERWLITCQDARCREPVAEVLAAGCGADTVVAGRLFRAAQEWRRKEPGAPRADVLSCLLQKLDTAQGIEPYGHAA